MKFLMMAATVAAIGAAGSALASPSVNVCPTTAGYPNITNVTTSGSGATRSFTITGVNFGSGPPQGAYQGDNPHFSLDDTTDGISAGGMGNLLVVYFASWSPTEIDIGHFGKRYGKDGYVFNSGDQVTVSVGSGKNINKPGYCVATYTLTLP